MYQLFEDYNDPTVSVSKPPGFNYIARIYNREIQTIVNYYNSRAFYLNNTNILVRILNSFTVPIESSIDRYVEMATTRGPYIAKHFGITSEINFGKIHEGTFYGDKVKEIYLYNENYFSPFTIGKDWQSLRPVTVLDHPISDLKLLLPNGKVNSTAEGTATIAIDIPMLLTQYRYFLLEQQYNSESVLGANHFVYKYVLPNMLYSHIDIVLMNRLMNLYYGAPMSTNLYKYPFPIVDYSSAVDKDLKRVLNRLKNSRTPYFGYLQNIVSIGNPSMVESLKMPDLAKTRQVWWAMFLTRLKVMKFLIDVGGSNGVHTNGYFIGKLKLDIKRLTNERIFETMLPMDMLYEVKETLEELGQL